MYGRYGLDQMGRFMSKVLTVLLVISLLLSFVGGRSVVGRIVYYAALLLLIWMYYRMFSKNISIKSQRERYRPYYFLNYH